MHDRQIRMEILNKRSSETVQSQNSGVSHQRNWHSSIISRPRLTVPVRFCDSGRPVSVRDGPRSNANGNRYKTSNRPSVPHVVRSIRYHEKVSTHSARSARPQPRILPQNTEPRVRNVFSRKAIYRRSMPVLLPKEEKRITSRISYHRHHPPRLKNRGLDPTRSLRCFQDAATLEQRSDLHTGSDGKIKSSSGAVQDVTTHVPSNNNSDRSIGSYLREQKNRDIGERKLCRTSEEHKSRGCEKHIEHGKYEHQKIRTATSLITRTSSRKKRSLPTASDTCSETVVASKESGEHIWNDEQRGKELDSSGQICLTAPSNKKADTVSIRDLVKKEKAGAAQKFDSAGKC